MQDEELVKGLKVLGYLIDLFLNNKMYLPPEYRADILAEQYEDLQNIEKSVLQKRLVCDYVSGMMDSYAISVYEKYSGKLFMGGHH